MDARRIALGGAASAAALAASIFAAGAAFASTPGVNPGNAPKQATSTSAGLTKGLLATSALPGRTEFTGVVSGLSVLSAVPAAKGLPPVVSPPAKHQSALTHHAAKKRGKRQDKKGMTTGNRRADLPIKGVSKSSGALPAANGIGGLLKGVPVSGLLGAAK